MDPNLVGFIKFLEDHNLVELDIIGIGDKQLDNRIKLQKYVLLARHFGLPMRYKHDIYLFGPFSRELAADYYALAEGKAGGTAAPLPDGFRRDDFLKALHNDPDWLEIAATIVDRDMDLKSRTAVLESVCHIKSGFERKFIIKVLGDLEKHGLVTNT